MLTRSSAHQTGTGRAHHGHPGGPHPFKFLNIGSLAYNLTNARDPVALDWAASYISCATI